MALKINIDSIIKLPTSKKIIILAAINIFIVVVIYWFFISPQKAAVVSLRGDLTRISKQIEDNRRVAADIPKYLRDKEELEAKLREAVSRLPNEKEIPDLIDAVSDAAKRAGLKILLFKPSREVQKGFYAEIPINMAVEGRFESLYDFSLKVGSLPRIVNLTSMEIISSGHKNRVPVLKAKFVATTFRFIPSPPAQGGK
ncbi:MAG: type 4a pilus biogenesis protein PilO [Thermodesulfobacteriota bacterium]|nr:MAG: type 4a pilus biogenesis protein PilO [Thermodesulfobacteriota bacterium]